MPGNTEIEDYLDTAEALGYLPMFSLVLTAARRYSSPRHAKPYAPTMVRLLYQRIIEKAGFDHIRFEDLRHTVAVHALESKMETKAVSALLGHTRPYTTRYAYAEYLPKKEEKVPASTQMRPPMKNCKKQRINWEPCSNSEPSFLVRRWEKQGSRRSPARRVLREEEERWSE